MTTLLDQLAEGRAWDPGCSAAVAARVLAEPGLIDELFDGLADENEGLRNRASRALVDVSAVRPDLLLPYKRELLTRVSQIDQWIVRANLCHLLPRLTNLTAAERRRALALARSWMERPSSTIVVKVNAFECVVRLSLTRGFEAERAAAVALSKERAAHGETAAMRARARIMCKLFAKLARTAHA
jgi:hypothetical protein